jgi:hypothetical protein
VPKVLLIGFDPAAVPGQDVAVAPAFAHARRRATQEGVDLTECLVGIDESADAQITGALAAGAWDCVVLGGGIRKPEPVLEFFEYIVNVVHRAAPGSVIAFNTSPADTIDAALRALALRASLPERQDP